MEISEQVQVGYYADFVALWHTSEVFVLDFAIHQRAPEVVEDDSGNKIVQIPARGVCRVRVPPGQLFELMKAMNTQLDAWEANYGKGAGPQSPLSP
jgi:hypothetical protein